MSSVNKLIRAKLLAMDGGSFQRLCDAWLFKQGYTQLNAIGMTLSSDKVTKGTPDTLLIQSNGKYVFSEYTTQQSNLFEKANNDIEKCLDELKTGINTQDISHIIYCHLSKLSVSDIQALIQKCLAYNIQLILHGIDVISLSLSLDFPVLAQEYLGIPITTGQILDTEDFIERYNKSDFTSSIGNELLFREEDLTNAIKYLDNSDILVISGPAGAGKTDFSVHVLRHIATNFPSKKIYCIYDKGADLLRDISTLFSEAGDYVIFVDDANRLDNRFDYILHHLNEIDQNKNFKVIATVRDYAKHSLITKIIDFAKPEVINLTRLTDAQIKELVEKKFNINNGRYQKRIAEIADGNPRLATMAAKVAVTQQDINSIRNVSELYEEYFSNNTNIQWTLGERTLKTAAIISFFRIVDKSNEEQLSLIEQCFNVKPDEFWLDAAELHSREIVDFYENEVVKVSDQILSTYLTYQGIFKTGVIQFETILSSLFPDWIKTIRDTLYPVLNSFSSDQILSTLSPAIQDKFHELKKDNRTQDALILIDSFWYAIPTDTLSYINSLIEERDIIKINWDEENFDESSNSPAEGTIANILSHFRFYGENEFKISFQLLLKYIECSPHALPEVIHLLNNNYCFKPDDYDYFYNIQKYVTSTLIEKSACGENYLYSRILLETAKKYLAVEFRTSEMGKGKQFFITTIKLPVDKHVCTIRSSIFKALSSVISKPKHKKHVHETLRHYVQNFRFGGREMMSSDSEFIQRFIEPTLDPKDLVDCFWVHDLIDAYNDFNVDFPSFWLEKYSNDDTKLADLIMEDINERRFLELDHNEYDNHVQKRITDIYKNISIDDYQDFLQSCCKLKGALTNDRNQWALTRGIERCFRVFSQNLSSEKYLEFIRLYTEKDKKLNIYIPSLIAPLMENNSVRLFELINKESFSRKKMWLTCFYQVLPENQITLKVTQNFLSHISDHSGDDLYHFSFNCLKKFHPHYTDIYVKVGKILIEKFQSDNDFSYSFRELFNSHTEFPNKLLDLFESDLQVIFDCYLLSLSVDNHVDYDGKSLDILTKKSPEFLYQFFDYIFENESHPSSHSNIPDICFLWERENYLELLLELGSYLFKKEPYPFLDNIFKKLFITKNDQPDSDALKEKKDTFFKSAIKNNLKNSEFMRFIFSLITSKEQVTYIEYFITFSTDFKVFEVISYELEHRGTYTGSRVPYLEKDKQKLLKILTLLNNIELLEHKAYVEKLIQYKEKEVDFERKRDFLENS